MTIKAITEIFYLAMLVHTNTDYCVFVRLSGHVDRMEVEIAKSKTDYNVIVAKTDQYIDKKNFVLRDVENAKAVLIGILEVGEIDYDLCECEEIIEVHREYIF